MPVSISHTPICQKWNISSSTYRILFGNFIPRYHLPTKLSLFQTFPPNFNLSVHSNRNHNTLRRFSAEKSIQSSDHESIEARKAVSEILKESGVSEEESLEMALNSPKYVKMLIDSVCELDESSLWDSWKIEKEDIGSLSFKEKVFYMAKEKGDKGILPFLESVGLNQSSLMHVARYLSSEKLVDLIDKLEARRGGLNMLDSKDASFPYLIESFPRLLLRSVESHFKPLAEYLESVGVPKGRIRIIILSFPPIVFYDVEKDIKPRLKALGKAGVGEQDVGKMLIKYPWILATSIQENYVDILSFFDMQKVPKVSVDHAIISWPHLLGCSTSKLKSMVEQFAELGVKNKKLGQVIASSPQLLLRKPHEFLEVVSFMEQLGFDEESIGRILSRCPEIFAANVENTLKKKLKFLSELGISDDNLPRVIRKYPELLVSDPNTLLPRMRYLLKIGLSKREVASMVKKFSPLLGYSIEEVLKPKVEFLVCTMGKPVRDVVEYPRYFSYSLEKKIKPRFWVLKGRDVECSLKDMLGKNDEDFAADYMGIGRMLVPPIPGGNK
ncbi:mitochondrial transcription termination factor family protein isoform X2 [Tasmannia lanceolata]|uniref:mitochondrial transcription termination factor family protein isoform X2 n=1 Tax=Tasmannia lanceolata TaxID=3420 RepID=UPI0040631719